jgi:predicted nucleic acid-binding protein
VLNGTAGIVYDNNVLVEYIDVLNREKFKINKESIKAVLEFIKNDGEYALSVPQKVQFADEDDRIFYELYKSGEVDFLITGNIKHFPKEAHIVTPREFIETMSN